MTQNYAEAFAPLVAAGFPAVQPGEPFVVAGDLALGLLQGAAQALPAPWVLLAISYEFTDEASAASPKWKGPRQWRCMIVDNVEAATGTPGPSVTATIQGFDITAARGLDFDEMHTAVATERERSNRFYAKHSLSLRPGRINFLAPDAALPQPKPRTSLRKMGLLVLVAAAVVAALA